MDARAPVAAGVRQLACDLVSLLRDRGECARALDAGACRAGHGDCAAGGMMPGATQTFQFGTVMVTVQRFSSGAVNVRVTNGEGKHGGWTMHQAEEEETFLAELCRLTLGRQHGRFEF